MSTRCFVPLMGLCLNLVACGDKADDTTTGFTLTQAQQPTQEVSKVEAQIAQEVARTEEGKQMVEAQESLKEMQRMLQDPRVGDGLKSPELALIAATYRGMMSPLEKAEWALEAQPKVERIPFRELYGFLAEVPAWTRGTLTGAAEVNGVPISRASTRYRQEGAIIELEVTDYGANPAGLGRALRLTWPGQDEEKEYGFERSGVMKGMPAFQEWKRRELLRPSRRGDTFESTGRIVLLVANRFTVELDSTNVGRFEYLIPFIESLDLDQLSRAATAKSSHL